MHCLALSSCVLQNRIGSPILSAGWIPRHHFVEKLFRAIWLWGGWWGWNQRFFHSISGASQVFLLPCDAQKADAIQSVLFTEAEFVYQILTIAHLWMPEVTGKVSMQNNPFSLSSICKHSRMRQPNLQHSDHSKWVQVCMPAQQTVPAFIGRSLRLQGPKIRCTEDDFSDHMFGLSTYNEEGWRGVIEMLVGDDIIDFCANANQEEILEAGCRNNREYSILNYIEML